MTYGRFHLYFNFPLTVLLCWAQSSWSFQRGELQSLGLVLLAVVIFTSPWDNWAVKRGIWDFPPGRFWRRWGYLPVEEYLFFVWQTVNVILSVRWILGSWPALRTGQETPLGWAQMVGAGLVLLIWAGIGFKNKWRPRTDRWWYGWHLLFWFLPVIALQWALAPVLFMASWLTLFAVTLAWGTYYVVADVIAVRAGIWFFDEKQITGWKLGGILPWEEIAFFYLTSLLVAQSYLLLLPAMLR